MTLLVRVLTVAVVLLVSSTSQAAAQAPSVPPSLAQSPRPTPAGEAVRYAAVWLLPLGLLLFGGYFGGALTRDIDPGSTSA